MLRFTQVIDHKNIQIVKAAEELKRGAVVVKDMAAGTVAKATAANAFYIVDAVENSDGPNALGYNDASFEKIEAGAQCLMVAAQVGERYATTEVDGAEDLTAGALLEAKAGKFAAATGEAEWKFGGKIADPTGFDMYIVERVAREVAEQTESATQADA